MSCLRKPEYGFWGCGDTPATSLWMPWTWARYFEGQGKWDDPIPERNPLSLCIVPYFVHSSGRLRRTCIPAQQSKLWAQKNEKWLLAITSSELPAPTRLGLMVVNHAFGRLQSCFPRRNPRPLGFYRVRQGQPDPTTCVGNGWRTGLQQTTKRG